MNTTLPIRRLNDHGIEAMEEFLDSFKTGEDRPLSDIDEILESSETTIHTPKVVRFDRSRIFERRFDLAEYLSTRIPALGLQDPTRDKGLWAWLALAWFDQLAPIKNGKRKVGERAKWIHLGKWKTYRHLVLGPYMLFQSNRDNPQRAMSVLFNPPHTPGELVGQLAATDRIVQSVSAISAASTMYYDFDQEKPKRGAGGSGPGSPRRYRTVLDQFDRTYDLQSMNERGLFNLLPREFNRFIPDGFKSSSAT